MITANFIHRTFRIAYLDRSGTGFVVDVDGRHYMVTARHVVDGLPAQGNLEIYAAGTWNKLAARLVGHANNDVDVTVLAPDIQLCATDLPVTVASKDIAYGQDVYFLGFPYGNLSKLMIGEEGYPLPLVKKGVMSAFAGQEFLVDAHGNSGFSGGPLLFAPGGLGLPTAIAAVVTDVNTWDEPVLDGEEPSGLIFRENTGIMSTVMIEVALEIVRQNPIGHVAVY